MAEQLGELGGWFHLITLVFVVVDGLVPMVPGEVLVLTSGVLARQEELSLWVSLLTAWVGIMLGDLVVYALFRSLGPQLLLGRRWGARVQRGVQRTLDKAGPAPGFALLLALRFVSGGRTAAMAAAGMVRMPWRTWLLLSTTGSAVWTVYMVGLGLLTGSAQRLPLWISVLVGIAVGLGVGSLAGALLWWRRRRGSARGEITSDSSTDDSEAPFTDTER
ncbi:DedA family protein [Citricoccus sp. NR2]|uniref:DedA family protein n=1 Tax=Citricoccus sp. NR2 TaxID=3004095 RepID=UPI0022DCE9FC|nr:DedA family protein [Citricoccus sp. NR2]WBL19243.1 DedA family protein [Citricoccus sp. NR2]